MYFALAVTLNVGPVMPSTTAPAPPAPSARAATSARPSLSNVLIMSILLELAAASVDDDLRHHSPVVLGVVAEVVEVGGVQEVGARGDAGGVDDHVSRLAAAQGDRAGVVVEVRAARAAQDVGA